MTAAELMSGLKPVAMECFEIFAPYYQARAKRYIYPSYLQSVCYMISKGNFYWKILEFGSDRVLMVISRSRLYGIFGLQLNIAPISLTGKVLNELSILKECLRQGFAIKLTSEDIRRFRVPQRLCAEIDNYDEYIYQAQASTRMSGSKYRKVRQKVKRVVSDENYRRFNGANQQIGEIVRAWDERYKRINGTTTHQSVLWEVCKSAPEAYVNIRSIFLGDTIQSVSVIERLSYNHFLRVLRVRNYQSQLNDIGSAMHWTDMSELSADGQQHPIYVNGGMADTEGLTHAKKALIPCAVQKIYKMKGNKLNPQLKLYFK